MQPDTSFRVKRIVVVSYRLPYSVFFEDGIKKVRQNSGGLVSAMSALSEKTAPNGPSELFKKVVWVGKNDEPGQAENSSKSSFIGRFINKYLSVVRKNKNNLDIPSNVMASKYQLIPVAIEKSIDDKYYGGFCNDCIW